MPQSNRNYAEALSQEALKWGKDSYMLRWALLFFVVSIVAGIFGFTGIAADAAEVARILFFIFAFCFAAFLIIALVAGETFL